jgi:hypothetical protein
MTFIILSALIISALIHLARIVMTIQAAKNRKDENEVTK